MFLLMERSFFSLYILSQQENKMAEKKLKVDKAKADKGKGKFPFPLKGKEKSVPKKGK